MRGAGLPIVLIVLGGAWLLNSLHWLPDVRWLWIFGLAGAGVAILLLDGVTKSSVVSGPLLILAGLMTFLRQYHDLGWRFIIPIMLICWGVTLLIARSPSIPPARLRQHHLRGDGRREGDSDA
ncbi:MAG: hypothetical protein WA924_01260 [Burkholderiaceae bacterium]